MRSAALPGLGRECPWESTFPAFRLRRVLRTQDSGGGAPRPCSPGSSRIDARTESPSFMAPGPQARQGRRCREQRAAHRAPLTLPRVNGSDSLDVDPGANTATLARPSACLCLSFPIYKTRVSGGLSCRVVLETRLGQMTSSERLTLGSREAVNVCPLSTIWAGAQPLRACGHARGLHLSSRAAPAAGLAGKCH